VVCWNAHSLCQECYDAMTNSDRSSNKNCAECREPMFNWSADSSQDPTTTIRTTTTTTTTTIRSRIPDRSLEQNRTQRMLWRGSEGDPFYDSPTRAGDQDTLIRLPTILEPVTTSETMEPAIALSHIFNRIIENYASRGWTGVDRYNPRVVRTLAREFTAIEYDFSSFSLSNLNWMVIAHGDRLGLNRGDRPKMVKFMKQFVLAGYPVHVVAAWIGNNLSTIRPADPTDAYTDARVSITDRTININHIRDNTCFAFQTIRQIF